MKKIFSVLLICLFIGFIGCSSDDDSKSSSGSLQAEYTKLLYDITNYEKKVNEKQTECDGLRGGRQIICRDQLYPMEDKLMEMKSRKRNIEKELGI